MILKVGIELGSLGCDALFRPYPWSLKNWDKPVKLYMITTDHWAEVERCQGVY